MGENNLIKLELKKDPLFREKKEPQVIVRDLSFSKERGNENNHDGEKGEKTFSLLNKDNQDLVGSIYYDYPKEGSVVNSLKVRTVGLEEKYRGQDLALGLYEHLINIAKDNKLDGICSDSVVQGGGLAIWKKLLDKGYGVKVNPLVEERWVQFVNTYTENKMFKEFISVPKDESVFSINF